MSISQDRSDYPYHFDCKPDFAFLTVDLAQGQNLKLEAGAMATMDTTLEIKTKFKGGFGRFLTGESLFINEISATHGPGQIQIAPACAGDMEHVYLEEGTIYLQNSAYVASSPSIEMNTKWQGFTKGFFSGENLFLIQCQGTGDLWFNTYGALIEIDVDGEYVVDTGHIVAFTDGLDYRITSVGGYKSLFLSGEGLVCRFSGRGKVWIQTRKVNAYLGWVFPFRPVKSSN
jgi:uncharacterized protein (TIGR00266 family)